MAVVSAVGTPQVLQSPPHQRLRRLVQMQHLRQPRHPKQRPRRIDFRRHWQLAGSFGSLFFWGSLMP